MKDEDKGKSRNETHKAKDDWENIFNSICDPTFILSLDHTILDANPAALKALGLKKEDVVGKKCYELIHGTKKPPKDCPLEKLLQSKHAEIEQMEMEILDGTSFVTVSPVLDEEGNIEKIIHYSKDITEIKEIQKTLAESEERYRLLVDNAPSVLWKSSEKGNTVFVSSNIKEIYGYTPEEIYADGYSSWLGRIHHDDLKEVEKAFQALFYKGEKFDVEYRIKRKDGEWIWLHDVASVVHEENGEKYTYGVFTDVTKRKKAEEKIKHLNLVLRSIRGVNQLIVKEKDRDKLIESICKNLVETRGYDAAWLALFDENKKLILFAEGRLGKDFASLKKQFKEGKLNECGKRALEQPGIVVIEDTKSECRDCPLMGKEPGGRAMTIRLEYGGKIYGLLSVSILKELVTDEEEQSLFREVSEDVSFALYNLELEEKEKKAEEELKESEERFRSMYENATIGIYRTTPDGRILMTNPALIEMLGFSSFEELAQRNLEEEGFEAGFPRSKFKKMMEEKGKVKGLESVWKRNDGKEIYVRESAKAFRDSDGNILYYEGTMEDITEQNKAQKSLKESEERYRKLFENSLSGIALHEVITDKNGKTVDYVFLEVNDAFEEQTGLKSKNIVGKRISEILPDVDKTFIEKYGKIALEGGSSRFETFSAPLGRYLEISVFSTRKGRFATVFKDITERVKHLDNMEFLTDSVAKLNEMSYPEELYQFVAKNIKKFVGDAVVVVLSHELSSELHRLEAVEGIGKRASTLLKLLGKDPVGMEFQMYDKVRYVLHKGKMKKMTDGISELTHNKIPKRVAGAIKRLLNIGDIYSIDMTRGNDLFGNVTLVLKKGDKLENKIILETFMRQASIALQRMVAQKSLGESESKFRGLVENAQDAIYIITAEGFEYVNSAFEKLTGYSLEEIYDNDFDFRNLIYPDDTEKIEERGKARERGEELPSRYEFRIIAKNGKTRVVEVTTVNIGVEEDVRVIGILRDMTERIKAEEKMERILEQEKIFKLEASHYFFNPIAIAKGYIDLTMEELPEEQTEKLKSARHAIMRVENVVKNVTQKGEIHE